ncbi:MAG: TlpA disulfide reductase family protein [Gaiellales bacterium]
MTEQLSHSAGEDKDGLKPSVVERPAVGRRRGFRWFVPLGIALALIGVIALFAFGLIKSAQGTNLVSDIAAGKKPSAPALSLQAFWPTGSPPSPAVARAIKGGVLELDRLRGHPVVVNFWASWCIACRAEAKLLTTAAATNPRVVFIGVDVQDLRSYAIGFLSHYGVTYTAVSDKTNSTYESYGLTGVPETYYLDRHGRIVAHDPGAVSVASLHGGIRKASG